MTTTPTSTPTQAPAPVRINPRIRERRIEVQRAAGRRRLRVLLVITSVLSAAGLAFLTITSPLLDVDTIRVTGARHVTVAQVRTASGVHVHDHLLFVDTGAVAHRLERLAWVEHASVKTDLPGTVQITIGEYTPVAYVRMRNGVMLVAANGHVIAAARTAPARTIEVRGVRRVPTAGALLSPPDAAGIVGRLPRALATRVVAVDVGGAAPVLDLAGGGEIRLGDTSDLDAKAASALAVLARLGTDHFSYIDVSTFDRPVSHG